MTAFGWVCLLNIVVFIGLTFVFYVIYQNTHSLHALWVYSMMILIGSAEIKSKGG